jgi:hypothetical protein
MSPERARRLARVAELRQLRGFRGWRGRRAWRRLVREGERGDLATIHAVWGRWVRDPDDEMFARLTRWWPTSLAGRVLTAVSDPKMAGETRAVVGACCLRHDVAPEDPVDRALFFALTGQADRHHAFDPDAALLATGYRGATEPTRAALRATVVGTGLVRAIAASKDTTPSITEFEYLTWWFADGGEWPALWRLVRDASLPRAVAAMPRFGRWRPEGDADRRLFAHLAAFPRHTLTDALTALTQAGSAAATVTTPESEPISAVSFAPDRPELAVATARGLHLFAVPSGRHIAHVAHVPTSRAPSRMAHLGERIIVVETGTRGRKRLTAYARGHRTVLWEAEKQPEYTGAVVAVGDRFVAAMDSDLLTGKGTPGVLTRQRLTGPRCPLLLATEPLSGRIVVRRLGGRQLSILDENLRVIAAGGGQDESRPWTAVFTAPDRLVTVDQTGQLRLWRQAGDRLRVERTAMAPWGAGTNEPTLCVFPALGQLALAVGGPLAWLDAGTLAPVEPPLDLDDDNLNVRLWSPTDGHTLAFRRDREIGLHDLAVAHAVHLLATPVSDLRPRDLATLAVLERREVPREATALLALLRTCVEHRFATEISLGASGIAPAEDDIALGGTP